MPSRLALRHAAQLAPLACALTLAAPVALAQTDHCDPSKGTIYAPAQGTNGTVLFEDLWPVSGDNDFNDTVVDYSYAFQLDSISDVVTIQATFTVLAVGAEYHNGLFLQLPIAASNVVTITDQDNNSIAPVAGEAEIVVPISSDTHDLFGNPNATFINTRASDPVQAPRTVTLTIAFDQGVPLDTSKSPFDIFIARSDDYTHQIHMPQYLGTTLMNTELFESAQDDSYGAHAGLHFVDHNGLPSALTVPDPIAWPLETISIEHVYPQITIFGSSNGTQNKGWYDEGVEDADEYIGHTGGAAAPIAPIAPDSTCITAYSDPTGHCIIFADQLIQTGNDLDACTRSPSPEYQEGWLNYDELYCTTTHICNVEYATWVFWHYSSDSSLPGYPHGAGSACDPSVPSQGCCENIPTIDEACQVDNSGACITVPTPNGYTQCAGPQ